MTNTNDKKHRSYCKVLPAGRCLRRGLLPDFSPQAIAELDGIHEQATKDETSVRDLRNLLWCSIDNDDSRDLDQLTVAESMAGGAVKFLVAIADVDAIVKNRSALDEHARHNTTSVYTAAEIFPMLPEKLSTDLTSLNFESDRFAVVVEMTVAIDGSLQNSDIYRALVRNHAKLAYNSVAEWLEGTRSDAEGNRHGGRSRSKHQASGRDGPKDESASVCARRTQLRNDRSPPCF